MDPAILNLSRMDRINRYLRLKMDTGVCFRLAQPSYSYAEIPLRGFRDAKGDLITEVKANQTVRVEPAATISLTGHHTALIQVNSKLLDVAHANGMFLLSPDEGGDLAFTATFRKGATAEDIGWAVRIFLLS